MKIKLTILAFILSNIAFAQDIQSPSEFLGYELGSRFTRHHQVVDYYQYLSKTAPKMVKLQSYGETYENRKLLIAIISSEENIANLESIRRQHLSSTKAKTNAKKAIVWLSYNVHGNESVSTEASMKTIYELLTQKQDWLQNTVVIIDPCLNPDGRDRYVNWYNQHKNSPFTINPDSKEHHEPWATGRSNHYLFDLNRDWAWLTQKESQQRLKVFNKWLPHIHVDFHEQGINDPYYFAPAAEPMHEVITKFQRDFQTEIGKNHAKYFDANGWLYFTKEIFDLLYPSYGDTFPTYNGGIGMTYEQGGSGRAGLGITTRYGDTLTLKDRIAHHHTTGLSTVEMATKNAQKLVDAFQKFHANENYTYKSYVLSGDVDKIKSLTTLLDQHEIGYVFSENITVKGYDYATRKQKTIKTTKNDLVIWSNQPKETLIKVLFEPKTKLSDSLTYDITAWSLPYAYGLDAIAMQKTINPTQITAVAETQPDVILDKNAYAYVTDWDSMKDARFLTALLKENINVRYSEEPFVVNGQGFDRGSLIITKIDNQNLSNFITKLTDLANQHQKSLTNVASGFVDRGKDFGSSSVKMIPKVRVALLSGKSTSTLNVGEIWHFFEQQLHYPVTILDTDYFDSIDLSKYDVLILPEGNYMSFFTDEKLNAIKTWVQNGGKLIAIGYALHILEGEKGFGLTRKTIENKENNNKLTQYSSLERKNISRIINGAIFKTEVDVTHPLAFGYDKNYFTLKLSSNHYEFLNGNNVVTLQNETKPYAGFSGSEALKTIENSLIFGEKRHGNGSVVMLVDNPLFRGFWENGKLFFANAVFMVNNK